MNIVTRTPRSGAIPLAAQPAPPSRLYSFTGWQASNPTAPPPGDRMDADYDNTNTVLTQTLSWAATSLNTDGSLKAGSVGHGQLVSGLFDDIAQDIIDEVQPLVDLAQGYASAAGASSLTAQAAATAADHSNTAVAGTASTATAAANAATAASTSAQGYATTAQTAATTAQTAANHTTGDVALAQDYADVTQAWAEHMPDTIPPNILAVMGVTGDHWSARWWANQAAQSVEDGAPGGPFVPLTGTTPDTGPVTGIVEVINNPPDPFNKPMPFQTHRIMSQIGQYSPFDILGMYGGTGGIGTTGGYDGIASAITVPPDATASGTHAIAGYVYTQSPQGGSDGVALLGVAVSDANNTHAWGSNIVLCDAKQFTPNGLTGQILNGMEMDVNLYNPGTAFHGIQVHQNFRNLPAAGSAAFQTASASYFYPATYSFASFQGAATNALYVGPQTFFPVAWQANHSYQLNQTTQPTTANGYAYVCTVAGTSGSTQPTFPTSVGTVTDGTVTWAWQKTLTDPSQAILFNFVDGTATPTQRQMRMQVLPSPGGGNMTISGVPGIVGLLATGAIQASGVSEILSSFNVPFVPPSQNPNNPAVWVASTAYAVNAQVQPVAVNGLKYICTVPGTSGATAPVWPGAGTVTDGTVTWSANGAIASGNNSTSYQSSNGVITTGLALGATQLIATAGTNTAGMNSQRINMNYSFTGSATLQSYQLVVAPTATGGTLQLNSSGADANLFVKSGLQVGSPTGNMGGVGTVKASGAGTFNGGFGVFTATTPVTAKPTVTGSRGGNAALASLITALAAYGLILDSTTA